MLPTRPPYFHIFHPSNSTRNCVSQILLITRRDFPIFTRIRSSLIYIRFNQCLNHSPPTHFYTISQLIGKYSRHHNSRNCDFNSHLTSILADPSSHSMAVICITSSSTEFCTFFLPSCVHLPLFWICAIFLSFFPFSVLCLRSPANRRALQQDVNDVHVCGIVAVHQPLDEILSSSSSSAVFTRPNHTTQNCQDFTSNRSRIDKLTKKYSPSVVVDVGKVLMTILCCCFTLDVHSYKVSEVSNLWKNLQVE